MGRVIGSCLLALAVTSVAFGAIPTVASDVLERCQSSTNAAADLEVRVIRGSEALIYSQQLRQIRPERFSNEGHELRRRGYRRANEATVIRVFRRQRVTTPSLTAPEDSMRSITGETEYVDSRPEGELVISSWDDGADGTWEGTMYFENHQDGTWSLYEGQIGIDVPDYYPVWGNRVGGGSLGPGGPIAKVRTSPPGADPGMTNVSEEFSAAFWEWVGCVVGGSYACNQACMYAGPYWPHCMGGCVGFVMFMCAVQHY